MRERVDDLLDPGSLFLELAPLAAHDLYSNDARGTGTVANVGRVAGRECMVVASDASCKRRTHHLLTMKKHLRAQQAALENRVIYL